MTSGQTRETLDIHVPKRCFRRKSYSRLKKLPNLTEALYSNRFLYFSTSKVSAVYSTYLTRHFESVFEKYFAQNSLF